MKLLPIVTLVMAGAALAACGTTSRANRFNETTYADHNGPNESNDREVVYRSYDDPDVVYVQPAYRVVPTTRQRVIYYYD
jgi:hypothetical protein